MAHSPVGCREFGRLPTGEVVHEFSLTNGRGSKMKAITLGGIITELHVPDSRGNLSDIVQGHNNLEGYLQYHPYMGALIGPVAGRIANGKFTIDGKDYNLPVNDPPNHLHGADVGYHQCIWNGELLSDTLGNPMLKLSHRSRDGEGGYPGNVEIAVTYTLTHDNKLLIQYKARTDKPTPISPTSHPYFNLAGEGYHTVEDHILQIFADEIADSDSQMTLLPRKLSVARSPADFNQPQRIGDVISFIPNQYGDNYFVRHSQPGDLAHAAHLEDPMSGRVMDVFTTENCLQLYVALYMDDRPVGKSGKHYGKYSSLCLECQGYPNGVDHPEMGDIVLRPGAAYHQTTIYQFSTK